MKYMKWIIETCIYRSAIFLFLREYVFDTSTHESALYHSLHIVLSIQVESVRSGILHMQYTGINSVHFIGSVSCLACFLILF